MNVKHTAALLLSIVVASASASPGRADIIASLYNTGVLDKGRDAPAGSADLHYTANYYLTAGSEVTATVLIPSFFPEGWVANTAFSQWIWANDPQAREEESPRQ
jgi:hypothetical protein